MKTLSIDPGKVNTWFTLWHDRKLRKSGQFATPATIQGCATRAFQRRCRRFIRAMGIGEGDEVVIERYMHRAGSGGNVAEIMAAIIWMLTAEAVRAGATVVLLTAASHKNSRKKFHSKHYPELLIQRLGKRHGKWRPRLKRTDPCEHVMDAASLGVYRILKRDGVI